MMRTKLFVAALVATALLTTQATARQSQTLAQRANARAATGATDNACSQIYLDNLEKAFRCPAPRDVWGHWGSYYGPTVHVR